MESKGIIEKTTDFFTGKINTTIKIKLMEKYNFLKRILNIKGNYKGEFDLELFADKKINFNSKQIIENLYLELALDTLVKNKVAIHNLNLKIPLYLRYDLQKNALMEYKNSNLIKDDNFEGYLNKRGEYLREGNYVKNLVIDSITLTSSKLNGLFKNIEIDCFFDNNRLALNYYYFEALDGNFGGACQVDFKEGTLDSSVIQRTNLDFMINGAKINTLYLSDASKVGKIKGTDLNFLIKLASQGLDILKNPKLDGEVNITRISDYDAKVLTQNLEIVEFFEDGEVALGNQFDALVKSVSSVEV